MFWSLLSEELGRRRDDGGRAPFGRRPVGRGRLLTIGDPLRFRRRNGMGAVDVHDEAVLRPTEALSVDAFFAGHVGLCSGIDRIGDTHTRYRQRIQSGTDDGDIGSIATGSADESRLGVIEGHSGAELAGRGSGFLRPQFAPWENPSVLVGDLRGRQNFRPPSVVSHRNAFVGVDGHASREARRGGQKRANTQNQTLHDVISR